MNLVWCSEGLTALKFGASSSAGVDIDEDALLSAANNCKLNDLQMDLYLAAEDGQDSDLRPLSPSFI